MFEKLQLGVKKYLARIIVSTLLVLTLSLHILGYLNIGPITRLENALYDARINLMMPHLHDDRIVIIDIDEKSLKEQGRWPWNRKLMAQLMDQCFDYYKIKVLGFDMVFAEADESSGLKNLELIKERYLKDNQPFKQTLDKLHSQLNYDQIFADHLKNRPIVLGFYFNQSEGTQSVGEIGKPLFDPAYFDGLDIGFIHARSFGANLDILQKSARSSGHFNFLPDVDGTLRRIPMLQEYEGGLYPSLSLAMAKVLLNGEVEPDIAVDTSDTGSKKMYANISALKINSHTIPLDETVSALIPFHGPKKSFPYISATDVIKGQIAKEKLAGKIVLIGTTAPGLMDLRATPTDSVYPGVEAHASMISGILDNDIKKIPNYSSSLELALLVLVGLILSIFLAKSTPVKASWVTLILVVAIIATNLYAWQHLHLVLPLATLLLLILAVYIFNMAYGFFYESRGKRHITKMFGQYIPPDLVSEMAKNPENYSLESESRELTVLFSDVRGFTSISEKLDPKELSDLMNEYLSPMTKIIHENQGTIDKYMGDAIMAFWGAPIACQNHAEIALKASMEMIKTLSSINQDFVKKGWPAIDIGIGLNTGHMTVGNMGSTFRMAYTVMGDAVNLGSRLEGLTKEYGVNIIISEFTKDQVPNFAFRELDCVRVKGKDKPVTIYEPLGTLVDLSSNTKKELEIYAEGLRAYKQQHWTIARELFQSLKQINSIRLYTLYLERVNHYCENPPPKDWDGAFTFKTK